MAITCGNKLPLFLGAAKAQFSPVMLKNPLLRMRNPKNGAWLTVVKKLILLSVFIGIATPSSAGVQVRDADTIVVDGKPIRLDGVDAPELKTRAGQDAKRWMVGFLRDKSVACDLTGKRTYDRWVGVCYADGIDVGAAVIAAGFALDCAKFSGGRYRKLETPAAKSRIKRARYC